jgi:hypothetical protein
MKLRKVNSERQKGHHEDPSSLPLSPIHKHIFAIALKAKELVYEYVTEEDHIQP